MSWSRDSTVSLILGARRDVLIYLAGPLFSEAERRFNLEQYLQNGEKLLVGLHTDTRTAFIGGRLNPMVRLSLDYVVDDEETLLRLLAEEGSGVEADTE
jgi:hypothetical protein